MPPSWLRPDTMDVTGHTFISDHHILPVNNYPIEKTFYLWWKYCNTHLFTAASGTLNWQRQNFSSSLRHSYMIFFLSHPQSYHALVKICFWKKYFIFIIKIMYLIIHFLITFLYRFILIIKLTHTQTHTHILHIHLQLDIRNVRKD